MQGELSHTELMERLYNNVKDRFDATVQWYADVVKLNLEARSISEQTKSKPEKYKTSKASHLGN